MQIAIFFALMAILFSLWRVGGLLMDLVDLMKIMVYEGDPVAPILNTDCFCHKHLP